VLFEGVEVTDRGRPRDGRQEPHGVHRKDLGWVGNDPITGQSEAVTVLPEKVEQPDTWVKCVKVLADGDRCAFLTVKVTEGGPFHGGTIASCTSDNSYSSAG